MRAADPGSQLIGPEGAFQTALDTLNQICIAPICPYLGSMSNTDQEVAAEPNETVTVASILDMLPR